MANEISNRTLAVLLMAAIATSLFGTFISLNKLNKIQPGLPGITGMASSNGTVSLEVTSLASFTVATNVNFGQIQPNTSGYFIDTDSDNDWAGGSANHCSDWTLTGASACSGLEIENDGNEVINLSFRTTTTPASLIGGTDPLFQFLVRNGNRSNSGDNGCTGTLGNTTWTNITAAFDYPICNTSTPNTGFNFTSANDMVTLEFRLWIPADAPQAGTSTATITISN